MIWNYAYTPRIWPSGLTILLLVVLALYSWRRRTVPGALPLMISCLFATLLIAGEFLTYLAVDAQTKIFWFRFETAWFLPMVSAVTFFILEYAWPGRWLTRRNLVLMSIIPLFGIYYFLTAGYLTQPMPDFLVGESVTVRLGPVGKLLVAYLLTLTLVNLMVFAWLFIRSPQHRWPVVLMAASQIAARTTLLEASPSLDADILNIPVLALPFVAYAIALFGFRIFSPIPLARQIAVEQMQAGLLVLDLEGRVASLNPAAERLLDMPASRARGERIQALLPAYPHEHTAETDGSEIELDLGSGAELRHCTLAISQLRDFRGLEVGHLHLLHDVTEQKRVQAHILEQQRVMATQNERERMARELHDSLGQVLSFASLQAETAAKLARDGRGATAAEQLDRLSSVVREAHADLREVILNLHSTASLQQPFFAAVKHYLDGFAANHDILTTLSVDPGSGEESFTPENRLHIFRVLQEALSNARKHGRAHRVQITFTAHDGSLSMSIQDDGCGFDPEQVSTSAGSHYGLHYMQARASQMGGSLQVQSAPGAGTLVRLVIPTGER